MVGLSGGKDSWALIQILDVLRQRAPIDFSLVAVNVDSGYEGYQHELVAAACAERGWEFHIEHTSIGEMIDDVLDADADAVLALRAAAPRRAVSHGRRGRRDEDRARPSRRRLRRDAAAQPVLRRRAQGDAGAARVRRRPARRHPAARLRAAKPRRAPTPRRRELPVIGCCCPACGDLSLQRQRIKRLLMELEREHPDLKQSLLKSLGNVQPRHLLDRAAQPAGRLRPRAGRDSRPLKRRARRSPVRRSADRIVRAVRPARLSGARVSSSTAARRRRRSARGLLVLLGVERGDGPADRDYIVARSATLRIFDRTRPAR